MGGNDYRENSETTQADRFSGNYAENDTGNENRRGTHRMQEHTGNENRRGTRRMQEHTGESRAEEFERNRILKRTGMAFLGMSIAALIAISSMNSVSTVDTSDAAAEALEQGESTELGAGTRILMKDQEMPARDYTIVHSSQKDISELQIWDYAAEGGDYVQVLVDDVPLGDPFMIKNKPVTLTVPATGVVQVLGTRDGGGGITYAVRYDFNNKTYFNGTDEGEGNLYTLIRE